MSILTSKLAHTIDRTRCGVIPYTVIRGKIFFLCAVDKDTKEYGDFGGGVKKIETALKGGLREFEEESLGIFFQKKYEENSYTTTLSIDDPKKKMSIIFCPVENIWKNIASKKFRERVKNFKGKLEVCDIIWLDFNSFFVNIFYKEGKMWNKIKNFFYDNLKVENYIHFIKTLKIVYHNIKF